MKKLVAMIGAFLLLAGVVFAADPAVGLWKSIDDKTGEVTALWRVYEKDGMLYGAIAATVGTPQDSLAEACKDSYKNFPVSGVVNKMKVVDTPWIFGMKKESEGNWKDGNIIDPSNGKMYGCVMKYLKPGEKNKKYTAKVPTLAMAGTVGPIQVFQYWEQATEAEIKAAQEKYPAKK